MIHGIESRDFFAEKVEVSMRETSFKLLHVPLCDICRDQIYDFAWVSIVQLTVFSLGLINGYMFVIEEILLFIVLVIVKHRLPAPWDRSG